MSGVAAAVAGSAVLGAVVSSTSAQNAANAQSQAADRANQQSQTQFQQQRADMLPYMQAGQKSLADLQTAMPDLTRQFGASDFQQDPGYQFTLNQGLQAMQRSAAAKGFLDSTGTMQNLNNYAQDVASNQYGNAYNRFTQNQQQKYNMLSGVAGMGNTANGQMAQVGMNNTNNMNQNTLAQGNAASAGMMAQGNAMGNALNTGANGYMNMSMMNRFMPQQQSPMPGAGMPQQQGAFAGGGESSMSDLAYA